MGIYLGSTDIGVTEQLLYRPELTTGFQDVGGETMPQGVGSDLTFEAGPAGVLLQDLPEPLPGQSLAAAVQEEGPFRAGTLPGAFWRRYRTVEPSRPGCA